MDPEVLILSHKRPKKRKVSGVRNGFPNSFLCYVPIYDAGSEKWGRLAINRDVEIFVIGGDKSQN